MQSVEKIALVSPTFSKSISFHFGADKEIPVQLISYDDQKGIFHTVFHYI